MWERGFLPAWGSFGEAGGCGGLGGGFFQVVQQGLDQGGFSAAVGSLEDDAVAGLDGEVQVLE